MSGEKVVDEMDKTKWKRENRKLFRQPHTMEKDRDEEENGISMYRALHTMFTGLISLRFVTKNETITTRLTTSQATE